MTGLADQGGSEGESAATLSGMLSLTGEHTPWKDPCDRNQQSVLRLGRAGVDR